MKSIGSDKANDVCVIVLEFVIGALATHTLYVPCQRLS